MFTGIITATGVFESYRPGPAELAIAAEGLAERIETGGSLAVDGVCLTLVRREKSRLVFNLSRETSGLTTLGGLRPGVLVNLELPVTPASPLGGHLVSGHVDFMAKVLKASPRRPGIRLTIALPRDRRPFFVTKGSAAVNGVSLTVAAVGPGSFDVELIPATLGATNLDRLRPGAEVNIECDLIGKYVYNFLKYAER